MHSFPQIANQPWTTSNGNWQLKLNSKYANQQWKQRREKLTFGGDNNDKVTNIMIDLTFPLNLFTRFLPSSCLSFHSFARWMDVKMSKTSLIKKLHWKRLKFQLSHGMIKSNKLIERRSDADARVVCVIELEDMNLETP